MIIKQQLTLPLIRLVFHERTKLPYLIIREGHFVREKIAMKKMVTPYVKSEDQLADIFTKALGIDHMRHIASKLGMIYIYAEA